ncbi:death-associated protein-like 1 isoform X3 [Eretmochelys imbricata]
MEVGELPKSKKMQLLRKIPRTLEKRRQGGLRKCLPSNERHKDLNLVSLTKRRKSSIVSVTKMQNMGVLLADALEKILQTCSFLQDREEVLRYHNGLVL